VQRGGAVVTDAGTGREAEVQHQPHLWGAGSAPVASVLQFAGSAGVWRNPAYAASSDRQAA
jgi:hypothetical protein